MGIFVPETLSVGDLFVGALIPGLLLVLCYILYLLLIGFTRNDLIPDKLKTDNVHSQPIFIRVFKALVPPLLLMLSVLGSILTGAATPTEAAAVGAVGATILALFKK